METKNLADLYHLAPLDWTRIEARLAAGISQAPGSGGPDRHTCWLATIDADGRPHLTGIGALWVDGAWWFETGRDTRKGRNLRRDPRCTLTVSTHEFDLAVEGVAEVVADPAVVAAMAARWPLRAGRPNPTRRARRSPPSSARRPLDRRRGTSTGSLRWRPPPSARWTPVVPPAGPSDAAVGQRVARRRMGG